jgi:spore coat protein U-like protein
MIPARLLLPLLLLAVPKMACASCASISASGLAFGTYTGVALTSSTATVTLNTCTASFAYSVGLNAGTATGASVSTRKMSNGTATLNYFMYQDSASTVNWGNTKASDAKAGTTAATLGNTVLTIYAKLLATQYPAPGTYTDTITATAQNSGNRTTTFTVTSTVLATCSFTTTDLNFGTYTGAAINASSTVTVTCTNTTPYQVGLNSGNNSGGAQYSWKMASSSGSTIAYELYRDSGRTNYWGNSLNTDTVTGTGTGFAQALTVYGSVFAGLRPTPGAYSDIINVTLTY